MGRNRRGLGGPRLTWQGHAGAAIRTEKGRVFGGLTELSRGIVAGGGDHAGVGLGMRRRRTIRRAVEGVGGATANGF